MSYTSVQIAHLSASLFVTPLDENLMCCICLGTLQDPHQCQNGHNCCKSCIEIYLQDGCKPCPMRCSCVFFSINDLVKNRALAGLISNLVIRCPSAELGGKCDWTGMVSTLQNHEDTCPYTMVTCSCEGCVELFPRKDIEHHELHTCVHRKAPCVWCHVPMTLDRLTFHQCDDELIPCPHECNDSLGNVTHCTRRTMWRHLQFHCQEAITSCSFSGLGCDAKLPRKEMLHHEQLNGAVSKHHQSLMLSVINQQKRQIAEHQRIISSLIAQQSVVFCEIVYSISIPDFILNQTYDSSEIECMGRKFSASFFRSNPITSNSYHNLSVKCVCSFPTRIRNITAELFIHSSNIHRNSSIYSSPWQPENEFHLLATSVQKDVTAFPFAGQLRNNRGVNDGCETSENDRNISTQISTLTTTISPVAWMASNFIKSKDLTSYHEGSFVISVKISIDRL